MIRFLDGPAAGVILRLARTPILLRVVEDHHGKFDALDQLNDTPRDGERIHVYRINGEPSWAFIDYRDKQGRRRGERIVSADYAVLPDQPPDEQVRTTEAWRAWTKAWAEREGIKA